MKRIKNILRCSLLVFALLSGSTMLAGVDNLPICEKDGQKVHYYEVLKGETLYSISHKLEISIEDIERENPSVKTDGLKAGQNLYFRIVPSSETAPVIHVVEKKETVYGIAKKYGITQQQLSDWNPVVKEGIRPGQRLIVSDPALSSINKAESRNDEPRVSENNGNTYTIGEGESLYAIAKNNNTTVDRLIALNPELDREKYRAGTVINLPDKEEGARKDTTPQVETSPTDGLIRHTVKKKETMFSISHQYGLTVEELERANPGIGVLRKDMVLVIPQKDTAIAESEESVGNEEKTSDSAKELKNRESIDIALLLPLMVDGNNDSKQAQLYREFYKGFLVGVDSMRNNRIPVDLKVYDTRGTRYSVENILKDANLTNRRLIIAPDNSEQFSMVADFGQKHNVDVLNLFLVSDKTYQNNPAVIQGNIPSERMYEKAVRGIFGNKKDYVPVIVRRKGGSEDKKEYIDELKNYLKVNGREFKEIEFVDLLELDDLKGLTEGNKYVIVPVSGKQTELDKILPGLLDLENSGDYADKIILNGFPEWIAFKGAQQSNMHHFNTEIFSRFYYTEDDYLAKRVMDSYERWYGEEMGNFMPREGVLGFDTARFLIEWLTDEAEKGEKSETPKSYYGAQNSFVIRTPDGSSGKANDSLYIINYRPSGEITKSVL